MAGSVGDPSDGGTATSSWHWLGYGAQCWTVIKSLESAIET